MGNLQMNRREFLKVAGSSCVALAIGMPDPAEVNADDGYTGAGGKPSRIFYHHRPFDDPFGFTKIKYMDGNGNKSGIIDIDDEIVDGHDHSISPDGRYMVCLVPRVLFEVNGRERRLYTRQDVVLLDMTTGDSKRWEGALPYSFRKWSWCQNSKKVALNDNVNGGSYIFHVDRDFHDGENPRLHHRNARHLSFSPDGKHTVDSRNGCIYLDDERITDNDVNGYFWGASDSPVWSPDGRHILIIRNNRRFDPRTLSIIDFNGTPISDIARYPHEEISNPASWSPDGKRVSYGMTHYRPDIIDGVTFNVPIRTIDVWSFETGEPVTVAEMPFHEDIHPDSVGWSPEGDELIFNGSEINPDDEGLDTVRKVDLGNLETDDDGKPPLLASGIYCYPIAWVPEVELAI